MSAPNQFAVYRLQDRGSAHPLVHRKAGQNQKSMAIVFVSQKFLVQRFKTFPADTFGKEIL